MFCKSLGKDAGLAEVKNQKQQDLIKEMGKEEPLPNLWIGLHALMYKGDNKSFSISHPLRFVHS